MKNIFKIDNSTYLLILFGLLSGYIKNIFIILIIVLIHEIGHVFFFYLFNIEIENVVIYPFGGVTKVNKRIHERIYKDILISLGGIIFQLLLFLVFNFMYRYDLIVGSTYDMFNNYNKSIILFNLIPIIPLDGSKLLLAICTKFLSYKCSYLAMIIIGILSLIGFILFNFIFRMNDLIIYIFLFFNLIKVIKDFKYVINKFFLERVLYEHYYDSIMYDKNLNDMRIDKYYYFKDDSGFINEKRYLEKNRF
jgi:stage IV sporulation protein FB